MWLSLTQTVRQPEARTVYALVRSSLNSSHGRVTPRPSERERLCGCSHVYVWEISNDERMPFQVWARGASVQCPTLSPYTHTLLHVCAYIGIHNGICTYCMFATLKILQDCRYIAFQIHAWHWFSCLSGSRISAECGSCSDTSHSSIVFPLIFPSSSSPNERASLFYSACMWPLSFSSLTLFLSVSLAAICLALFSVSSSHLLVVSWIIIWLIHFLGVPVPMPRDRPRTLDLPCHYPSTPNQTEEVLRFKAVSLTIGCGFGLGNSSVWGDNMHRQFVFH